MLRKDIRGNKRYCPSKKSFESLIENSLESQLLWDVSTFQVYLNSYYTIHLQEKNLYCPWRIFRHLMSDSLKFEIKIFLEHVIKESHWRQTLWWMFYAASSLKWCRGFFTLDVLLFCATNILSFSSLFATTKKCLLSASSCHQWQ